MKSECPHCEQRYNVEVSQLNTCVTCSSCGNEFIVEELTAQKDYSLPFPEPQSYKKKTYNKKVVDYDDDTDFISSSKNFVLGAYKEAQAKRNENIDFTDMSQLPYKKRSKVYKRNIRYFNGGLFWIVQIAAFIVGAGVCVCMPPALIVAIPLLLINMIFIFLFRPASAREIDSMADAMLSRAPARAIEMLTIDPEEIENADTICFRGWNLLDPNTLTRDINDDRLLKTSDIMSKKLLTRSPVVEIHYFAFSENFVHHYYKYESIISSTFKEGINEYSYDDITNASIEHNEYPQFRVIPLYLYIFVFPFTKRKYQNHKKMSRSNIFLFVLNSSHVKKYYVRDDDDKIMDAINAMRTLIKQRKQAKGE